MNTVNCKLMSTGDECEPVDPQPHLSNAHTRGRSACATLGRRRVAVVVVLKEEFPRRVGLVRTRAVLAHRCVGGELSAVSPGHGRHSGRALCINHRDPHQHDAHQHKSGIFDTGADGQERAYISSVVLILRGELKQSPAPGRRSRVKETSREEKRARRIARELRRMRR